MLPVQWNDPIMAPIANGPINRVASIFDRILDETAPFGAAWSGVPMAMWEDDDHLYIEVDLPGVCEGDVDVTVHRGKLFIRGERKPAEGRDHLYDGRCYGRFERVITLPRALAADDVRAELKDGVLSLTFPKSPEARPKKIELKTS